MRILGSSYIVSPQQLTSCDSKSYGCSGGYSYTALDYIMKVGGIEQESDYPYSSYYGETGICTADQSKFVVGVSDYHQVIFSRFFHCQI